jgi:methionyl-tRNA formyltransferase
VSRVRTVFLGTPDFAVTCLKSMLQDEHFEIVGVVTQPDRPSGRKMLLTKSPVRVLSEQHGLRVLTPVKMNDPAQLEELKKWGAELAVVVAFGQILSQDFLKSFSLGCFNVHASLLPRWRGAAPIQRAIEAGDSTTGVALQKMVKELDAGDVLGFRKIEIGELNSKELHDQLALLATELLQVELMDFVRGNLTPVPQDSSQVTFAKKIDKSESHLAWKDATQIHNKVRAFIWGPGTYFLWNGVKVKVHKTKVIDTLTTSLVSSQAGRVIRVSEEGIDVQAEKGVIRFLELQPESRTKMLVGEFIKGHKIKQGDFLQ